MTAPLRLRPHKVLSEERQDGTIILRSGYELGPYPPTTIDWLERWASESPRTVFLAERHGNGWREEDYRAVLERVQQIAGGLLDRGLNADTPIAIISGNSLDHGLLVLAAQHTGIPTVSLAEQYALVPAAHPRLVQALEIVKPAMVYASDAAQYEQALALPVMAGKEVVVSRPSQHSTFTPFEALHASAGEKIRAARAKIGPDTLGKILLTSGSTGTPKGVLITQRMMCVGQRQIANAFPFLEDRKPVIVDWLPWNHVFGGTHNFNMILAHGGSLYIDDGRPVPGRIERTVENLRMKGQTLAFNVPVGFSMLLQALRGDDELQRKFFCDLDLVFYAGASLPQDVWEGYNEMSRKHASRPPLMVTGWGLTEGAPSCTFQYEASRATGDVGVPLDDVELKLMPLGEERYEVRFRGPNRTPGYFKDPETSLKAFDDEGYFITGDALIFIDPLRPDSGLRFDGRISEDFKLLTGTWVRAANVRLVVLAALAGLAEDVVLTGLDRSEIGALVFPKRNVLDGMAADGAIYASGLLHEQVRERLAAMALKTPASSTRVGRAIIVAEPPSLADGEMTPKGNLNFRRVLQRRAALVDMLYAGGHSGIIVV